MSKKKKEIINLPNEPIVGVEQNPDSSSWNKRVMVFTPTTGNVRMEWVNARYGQIIPTNWSIVQLQQFLSPYVPIEYQLADAQNLMAKKVVEEDTDWVLYIEHDNIVPEDLFLKVNEYINDRTAPVISGLYFTRAEPSEPVLYRGRGNSYYSDWKMGDKVMVDGIPFGCRLEDANLIKEAWKTSPEYMVGTQLTRRVFDQPQMMWYNEEKGGMESKTGTTDLNWCNRIIEEKLLEKCGWPEYQKMKYPFMVDTNIFVRHISPEGVIFPKSIPKKYLPDS